MQVSTKVDPSWDIDAEPCSAPVLYMGIKLGNGIDQVHCGSLIYVSSRCRCARETKLDCNYKWILKIILLI